jgi:hypothetical protein
MPYSTDHQAILQLRYDYYVIVYYVLTLIIWIGNNDGL